MVQVIKRICVELNIFRFNEIVHGHAALYINSPPYLIRNWKTNLAFQVLPPPPPLLQHSYPPLTLYLLFPTNLILKIRPPPPPKVKLKTNFIRFDSDYFQSYFIIFFSTAKERHDILKKNAKIHGIVIRKLYIYRMKIGSKVSPKQAGGRSAPPPL